MAIGLPTLCLLGVFDLLALLLALLTLSFLLSCLCTLVDPGGDPPGLVPLGEGGLTASLEQEQA